MSVAPSPSSGRGEIVIQPAYFTSSIFVNAARADIDRLICLYSQQYTQSTESRNHPFALFREIWVSEGWTWIHFKVFDARSREMFLRVAMRLFSERIDAQNTPLDRVVGLFGLYMLFSTQPSTLAPPLYTTAHVQVTWDQYRGILSLPDALNEEPLIRIRPYVIYVQSALIKAQAFQVLPCAEMYPLNPRELPREIFVEDDEVASLPVRKKKGRPSKRDKRKQARDSVVALEKLLETSAVEGNETTAATRASYAQQKADLLRAIGSDVGYSEAFGRANEAVVERMKAIGAEALGSEGGIGALERVVGSSGTGRGGILGLIG